MGKPVIFFSHCAKDSDFILKIKNLLLPELGDGAEIFMSSDGGESIEPGRNSYDAINNALKKARIMFVFLTENSKSSNWVHYEAGFGCGRKIPVIPVVNGIDFSAVNMPLKSLQGLKLITPNDIRSIISDIYNVIPELELKPCVRKIELEIDAEPKVVELSDEEYDFETAFVRIANDFFDQQEINLIGKDENSNEIDTIETDGLTVFFERTVTGEDETLKFEIEKLNFIDTYKKVREILDLIKYTHNVKLYVYLNNEDPIKYEYKNRDMSAEQIFDKILKSLNESR